MVGKVDEALAFAQQRLRPFKQCRSSQHQQLLRETLALLAYPDPAESPMSYLVSDEHRRKAARVVNAAILFHLVNSHSDSETGASAFLHMIDELPCLVSAVPTQCEFLETSAIAEVFKEQACCRDGR